MKPKQTQAGPMTKVRIIERTAPDGRKDYVIQQRHFLFKWAWVDAWLNSWCGAACQDSWPMLAEAQAHLCWFDGTKHTEVVVQNAGNQGQTPQGETNE